MCPHFIKAIEGTLQECWTAEVGEAYKHIFAILAFNMKESMLKVQKENKKADKRKK